MRSRLLALLSSASLIAGALAIVPAVAADAATTTPAALLSSLTVAAPDQAVYDRAAFEHWIDADGDHCDTRSEVLQAETLAPVAYSSGCTVKTGKWLSYYDGVTYAQASDVDIDHLVPLAEAWRSGAVYWSPDQRRAYANDLGIPQTLVAVTDNLNQSKGDKDPSSWLPPLASAQCRYATEWVTVKYRWNLTVDTAEKAALASILTGSCGSTSLTAPAKGLTGGSNVTRYSGADRYATAVDIARQYATGVAVAYVATGTNYPDSLSAAPAAALGGPLLLTAPTSLPSNVRAELVRLQPQKIVVVGGTGSVSAGVFAQLSAIQSNIVRLAGADRYSTSRTIVNYAFGAAGASRVYLATGANFPDALSAGSAAGSRHSPVLLVPGTAAKLDAATTALIMKLHPQDVVIVGGTGSISSGIQNQVAGLGLPGGVIRVAGADRYEASRAVNHEAFTAASTVYLATGLNFPDGLAGGALAGRDGGPLYVVPGTCVPQSVVDDIAAFGSPRVVLFGGTGSLSASAAALTVCVKPPSVSISFSCSPTPHTTFSVTNPNRFPVSLTYGFDYNRNGTSDTSSSFSVAGNTSTTYTGTAPREDSAPMIRVTSGGKLVGVKPVSVNCVAAPPKPTPPPKPSKPANPGNSVNCADFATHAAAQAWFDKYYPYYGDVAQLDSDNDRIACENLP